MINFLLGFLSADILFSLILYFRKEIFLYFDKKIISFAIFVDIILLMLLLILKYVKFRKP
jgi:hypothetical protein